MDPARSYAIERVEGASDDIKGALRVAGVFAKIRPNLRSLYLVEDRQGIWSIQATYAEVETERESVIFSPGEQRRG